MDPISAFTMTFGIVLLISSWIYLGFVSFEDDFSWGLCTVFLPALSYLYACFAWKKAKTPLALAAIGCAAVLISL